MVEKSGGNLAGASAAGAAKVSAAASKESGKLSGLFSFLKKSGSATAKVGSAAVKGGKAAAPIIGKIAGGAGSALGAAAGKFGAAGAAVQVAGGAIAYKGVEQVTEAAKNVSFLMIILGFVHYLLRLSSAGMSSISYVLSLVLFILAGYALAAKMEKDKAAILIPMLFFVIWYFIFGGRYDPYFLTYFIIILVVISFTLALFSKGESVKPELLGLLPVLFLFLDIGLIPFLVDKLNFPITPLVESLVLFMPWWAFFGLMTLPGEASKNGTVNFLIQVARIGGILYLVFILVVPFVPNLGFDKSAMPTTGEFEEAQAKLRQKLAGKENPAYSNFVCIWSSPTDINTCVNQRQEASELKAICINSGHQEGTTAFDKCLQDEKEKKSQGTRVSGITASNIKEPTKAEFKESQYFPKTFYRKSINTKIKYPIEFKFENPRNQQLEIEFFCNFTSKLKPNEKSVPGKITLVGDQENKLTVQEKTTVKTIVCLPDENNEKFLNGSYKLTYEAKIIRMKTSSFLQRAFIGNKETAEATNLGVSWKEENIPKIMSAHFPGKTYLSQSSEDFARINFALGNPLENPVIEGEGEVFLASTIEDLGDGEIVKVHSYKIDLPNFTPKDNNCLQGEFDVPKTKNKFKEIFQLTNCQVTIPEDLKNPEDYLIKTFEAELVYDYLIKKEVEIEVKSGEE